MSVSDNAADLILQSLQKEVVKVFRVFDGSDRLIIQYEAVANAKDGALCLRTDYAYIGATTKLEKMKESTDVWSAAYDI